MVWRTAFKLHKCFVMESKEVFVPRHSPRITGQDRVRELIETSIAEQARVREKPDMKNERKRQCCHELDSHQSSNLLQQRRFLERAKQSSMTIHEREALS
ncbi:hypothetical protein C5167_013203 [Papaver somniferum]|uniref:Uncharacterized protein n=1 Tax=Papaver somniferum TaxID=3469 RepID=A0A4Y7J3N7_PAPSO|nr:hypothetical protein C5167_013203 [Papaver somniferum]